MNKYLSIIFVVYFLELTEGNYFPKECDLGKDVFGPEGNIGESKFLSWIGVLRTHIHEDRELKIGATGIILVSYNYAIGNADDITKIPLGLYKRDTKAMFIPKTGEPWFCTLVSYMAHPEYEYSTQNTIALLELNKELNIPVIPVCLPKSAFSASPHLYVAGYTDENKLLEKVIYRLEHVNKTLCEEFYERTGLFQERNSIPAHYQCGAAMNNQDHCEWDNGMALISNATGIWTLVGLGITSPGCRAPARFIDIHEYTAWIETSSGLDDEDDLGDQIFDGRRRVVDT